MRTFGVKGENKNSHFLRSGPRKVPGAQISRTCERVW
jgi:hypothetical protein